MAITGHLEADGRDLVLTRTVLAARNDIWAHLSRSDLLETWYGTYTGDPADGTVMVAMNAEPGEAAPAEYTIHTCEPGTLLTVSSAAEGGTWRLSFELAGSSEEPESADRPEGATSRRGIASTEISLRHHDVPADMVQFVGPGWEWYLDRLIGAVTESDVPGMDVWDEQYLSLAPEYAALTA